LELRNKNIVFGITGSFSLFKNTILQMKELVKAKATIFPIMSYSAYETDTKYGRAQKFIKEIEELTGNRIIHTIKNAETIISKKMMDIMIIAPCTGNTLAKLSMGIADTPVLFASKICLRNRKNISSRNFN